jgi:hypothetical protein
VLSCCSSVAYRSKSENKITSTFASSANKSRSSLPFNNHPLLPYSLDMSNAHRPTWNPAQGREQKGGSRQYSVKDLAAHTKLKFRQPGQTSTSEVSSSDLRVQLLIAERKAVDKKRKAQGLGPLPELVLPGQKSIEGGEGGAEEDGERAKRRKVLEEAVGLDRDDEDDEAEDDDKEGAGSDDGTDAKGKEKAEGSDGDDDDDDDDDSDDDEDDTAELLRELEKIKRERAEEKERQVSSIPPPIPTFPFPFCCDPSLFHGGSHMDRLLTRI